MFTNLLVKTKINIIFLKKMYSINNLKCTFFYLFKKIETLDIVIGTRQSSEFKL